MASHAQETTHADDRVRNGFVTSHEQVFNRPDIFIRVIENILAKNVVLEAPSLGDYAQFSNCKTKV
ncbi:hypothetical protein DVDV_0600 [Desulfovibrio sp. DV]|nr:hypothetical protein DVDV_0600 [Desulfovibrio sp. DV]